MLEGYDLSKYQTSTPNLDGISFVVLRASIATTKDTKYADHYAACRKAGVVTMAYHYGYPDDQAKLTDQAALFLEVAKDADFLWLDQEQAGFGDAQAQKFIDLVRGAGKPCGLYHSACGFGGVKADAKWVADWRGDSKKAGYPRTCDGSREFPGWDLWQYNGAGADNLDNDKAHDLAGLLRTGYVTKVQADLAAAIARQKGYDDGYAAGVASLEEQKKAAYEDGFLAGRQSEWDRQAASATVTLAPRP